MKAVLFQSAGAIAVTFALAAYISNAALPADQSIEAEPTIVEAAPSAPPQPVVERGPAPTQPTEPVYRNYLDAPQTSGGWTYADAFDGSTATYATDRSVELVLWCDKDTKVIGIDRLTSLQATGDRELEITTETVRRGFIMAPVRSMSVTAQFSPQDPILDAMAITKGRFVVGVEGERTLYLPAWVEVTRVIEDCR